MKRSRLLDVVSIVVVLVAILIASSRFIPSMHLLAMVVMGKSPTCSLRDALDSVSHGAEFQAHRDRLTTASRILEKDSAGIWLWETPEGYFWFPAGDEVGEGLISVLAEQMIHIYGDGPAGVQPGDIVLDCGAHIGVFTREALSRGAKLVVAVEPAPLTRLALERNLRKEIDAGRVVIYPKGVWDSETTMSFQTDGGGGAVGQVLDGHHHNLTKPGEVIEVPLTTIDNLVSELKLDRVDFIKMDIEGAERRALGGATRTLQQHKPRMAIASYHEQDDPVRIPQIVRNIRADYAFRCGPCSIKDDVIVPVTILFN